MFRWWWMAVLTGWTVDRIDPVAETARYVEKVMATKGRDLDEADRALMREDLASPCTEEVAVFHAFSRIVAEARGAFVVMDTAPTGHTLLLLDATGAYHRQMTQDMGPVQGRIVTPLMRLQDPDYTRVILVALPETTPGIRGREPAGRPATGQDRTLGLGGEPVAGATRARPIRCCNGGSRARRPRSRASGTAWRGGCSCCPSVPSRRWESRDFWRLPERNKRLTACGDRTGEHRKDVVRQAHPCV